MIQSIITETFKIINNRIFSKIMFCLTILFIAFFVGLFKIDLSNFQKNTLIQYINENQAIFINLYTLLLCFIGLLFILFSIKIPIYLCIPEKYDKKYWRNKHGFQGIIEDITNLLVNIFIISYILYQVKIIEFFFNYIDIFNYHMNSYIKLFGGIGMGFTSLRFFIILYGILCLPQKQD